MATVNLVKIFIQKPNRPGNPEQTCRAYLDMHALTMFSIPYEVLEFKHSGVLILPGTTVTHIADQFWAGELTQ